MKGRVCARSDATRDTPEHRRITEVDSARAACGKVLAPAADMIEAPAGPGSGYDRSNGHGIKPTGGDSSCDTG